MAPASRLAKDYDGPSSGSGYLCKTDSEWNESWFRWWSFGWNEIDCEGMMMMQAKEEVKCRVEPSPLSLEKRHSHGSLDCPSWLGRTSNRSGSSSWSWRRKRSIKSLSHLQLRLWVLGLHFSSPSSFHFPTFSIVSTIVIRHGFWCTKYVYAIQFLAVVYLWLPLFLPGYSWQDCL